MSTTRTRIGAGHNPAAELLKELAPLLMCVYKYAETTEVMLWDWVLANHDRLAVYNKSDD